MFVEHLRDDMQSTAEPVGKVARLIRQYFSAPEPLTGVSAPPPFRLERDREWMI